METTIHFVKIVTKNPEHTGDVCEDIENQLDSYIVEADPALAGPPEPVTATLEPAVMSPPFSVAVHVHLEREE